MAGTVASDPMHSVAEVLRRHRAGRCAARAAGSHGEVLLLRPRDPETEAALASRHLLDDLQALGFRYVALDLTPSDPGEAG